MSVAREVGAVVVHHNSLETIGRTIRDLVNAGIQRDRIVVVDNSGDAVSDGELEAATGSAPRVLRVTNRGYAAAVNIGLEVLSDLFDGIAYDVVVATHELRLAAGTLDSMRSILHGDATIGAVGPTLFDADEPSRLWSAGGLLTPRLLLPRHDDNPAQDPRDVEWLDGACVLYRGEIVRHKRLPENYFLYLEEVDFQQELRSDGWRIVLSPDAAYQSTGGMPGYYAVRNTRIFQRRWGTPSSRRIAPLYVLARQMARRAVRREGDPISRLIQGWKDGAA